MRAERHANQVLQLHEDSDGQVLLTTEDSDRFIRTQRQIVAAMRSAEDILARSQQATQQLQRMVSDIRAWCAAQSSVHQCIICPRTDDLLVVVVASDEDAGGALDDAISELDLQMFSRNGFRVSWLMLRSTDAAGLGAGPSQSREAFTRGAPGRGC